MFQSAVNSALASGIPGQLAFEGPLRAAPWILNSASAAYNVIGATALTYQSDGVAQAGGTGDFVGILADPNDQVSLGTSGGGTLAPSSAIPNGSIGEAVTMAELWVTLSNTTANPGDNVYFDQTTGALSSLTMNTAFTGVIATSGGVDTLTVSAISGASTLGIGSVVTGAGIPPNTVIKSLGTGTGGNGTYILSTSGLAVSSEAMTATSATPTGKTLIARCKVSRFVSTVAGLACITITQ